MFHFTGGGIRRNPLFGTGGKGRILGNIPLWNQLPAEILGTLPCKPNVLERGLGK